MVVKIIKPGVACSERIYTHKCGRCSCEFTFQKNDAMINLDRRDGDFLSIYCPFCNNYIMKSLDYKGLCRLS